MVHKLLFKKEDTLLFVSLGARLPKCLILASRCVSHPTFFCRYVLLQVCLDLLNVLSFVCHLRIAIEAIYAFRAFSSILNPCHAT
ncbi:hypothetical protein Plhal304r1_c017g0063041 [Plasmopara halstedii]